MVVVLSVTIGSSVLIVSISIGVSIVVSATAMPKVKKKTSSLFLKLIISQKILTNRDLLI